MTDPLRDEIEKIRVGPDRHYDEPRPVPTFFVDRNGCWIWTRNTDQKGYGQTRSGKAHRLRGGR